MRLARGEDALDYQTLDEKLQGRNKDRRKLANNTYAERRQDTIAIRLHATDVLTFYKDGAIRLDSEGWRTVTTKQRMNEYLSGWRIEQDRGQWYIIHSDGSKWERVAVYRDGAILRANGVVDNAEPLSKATEDLKLRRKVQRYASKYMDAFEAGRVPPPGPGDCFFCAMREVKTGKPLGELNRDEDHILSHIEEDYFVPSLLARAFETMPHSPAMGWAIASKWNTGKYEVKDNPLFALTKGSFMRVQLQKMLSRYILRQVNQAA